MASPDAAAAAAADAELADAADAADDDYPDDGMDVEGEEEYKPPSGRPTSARSRRGSSKAASSNGRANDRASNGAAVAAAAAGGLEVLPPRPPIKTPSLAGARSGSLGDGTGADAADSADPAALGLTGFEGYEGYDANLFAMSGDLDGMGEDLSAGALAAVNLSRQEKLKEKNRLAQRRFRARQKNMLEQMQGRMDELSDQVRFGGKTAGCHVGLARLSCTYLCRAHYRRPCRLARPPALCLNLVWSSAGKPVHLSHRLCLTVCEGRNYSGMHLWRCLQYRFVHQR
jgi:hypothetical protein